MKFFVTGVGGQLGHDVMDELRLLSRYERRKGFTVVEWGGSFVNS